MFLCQPLLDVLIARGIEDIDSFIQPPSWNDLPDPESIPAMADAVDRALAAIRDKKRIAIFGDYDCDGILGTHILRSVVASLGVQALAYLPHRDEGYGLSSGAVHKFSLCGTDLLITVDNGINAQREILLAQRLGVDVIVIDHHRIQEQANTLAVFCGAGLAALFAMALALGSGWKDERVERLQAAMSQYAAIASVADCVPLQKGTRTDCARRSRSRLHPLWCFTGNLVPKALPAYDEIRAFAFDVRKLFLAERAKHLAICSRCQRRLEYWSGLVESFDRAAPPQEGRADA